MSNDEKERQIGRLIGERRTAQLNLAHLNSRVREVAAAYTHFGYSILTPGRVVPDSGGADKLIVQSANGEWLTDIGKNLLPEASLAPLLREAEAARKRFAGLDEELENLGVKLKD
jgi:hypothetical protein